VRGKVANRGRVVDVFDKGKGALLEIEVVSEDGQGPLFTNRAGIFIRGEGGFGGDGGPRIWPELPQSPPEAVDDSPTLPQQALIYRLSGDKNPLHADPAVAGLAGFERPILHGLSTFGLVCRAVVDRVGGDPTRVSEFGGRFGGVVYPGETVTTSTWREAGGLLLNATVGTRQVFGPGYCRTG
jgi:acyl dehydratase